MTAFSVPPDPVSLGQDQYYRRYSTPIHLARSSCSGGWLGRLGRLRQTIPGYGLGVLASRWLELLVGAVLARLGAIVEVCHTVGVNRPKPSSQGRR